MAKDKLVFKICVMFYKVKLLSISFLAKFPKLLMNVTGYNGYFLLLAYCLLYHVMQLFCHVEY